MFLETYIQAGRFSQYFNTTWLYTYQLLIDIRLGWYLIFWKENYTKNASSGMNPDVLVLYLYDFI